MWELDYSAQVYTLLFSIVSGGVFALIFDTHTFVLKTLKFKKTVVFMLDLLLFLGLGLFTFCFFLARTAGEVRGYVFIGQIIGFAVIKFTLSKPLCLGLILCQKLFNCVFSLLKRFVLKPANILFLKICVFFNKVGQKCASFFKKRLKKIGL